MILNIINLDRIINNFFITYFSDPVSGQIFFYITLLANYKTVILLSILFTSYFLYKEKFNLFGRFTREKILPFWFAIFVAEGITFFLKYFIGRPGPSGRILFESDPSFPSGHSTVIVALLGIIYYLNFRKLKNRKLYLFLTILIIVLVDLSRLALNVHYLSDVVAGNIVGLIGVGAGIFVYKNFKR